jgi:hypothetical protein
MIVLPLSDGNGDTSFEYFASQIVPNAANQRRDVD